MHTLESAVVVPLMLILLMLSLVITAWIAQFTYDYLIGQRAFWMMIYETEYEEISAGNENQLIHSPRLTSDRLSWTYQGAGQSENLYVIDRTHHQRRAISSVYGEKIKEEWFTQEDDQEEK